MDPRLITIEIDEVEGAEMIIVVGTPAGTMEIVGHVTLADGVLTVVGAHVQGLRPGALTRAGLNAVAQRILEESGARALVVEGGTRTTGRTRGSRPRPIRFPRRADVDGG